MKNSFKELLDYNEEVDKMKLYKNIERGLTIEILFYELESVIIL